MSYKEVVKKLNQADAVLVSASNGLSITEGLHLFADNKAFEDVFGDFKRRYGLRCILHGMGAAWPSEEEKWAFWSRLVHHYCGNYAATPVMQDLREIIGDRDYFVVTSNGECHFEQSGFNPEKIYEVEGNWLSMQCARGCHDRVYSSFEQLEKMALAEINGRVPSEMIPHCTECGGPMDVHMIGAAGYHADAAAQQRYRDFLQLHHGRNMVVLELGIGPRNQLIKAPLMRLVAQEPNASYVTINLGELYIPQEIQNQSFGFDGYLDEILAQLRKSL